MSPIDDAFKRYTRLKAIIAKVRKDSLARPVDKANIDLGLVEMGAEVEDAKKRLREFYVEMDLRIDRIGFLDVVSCFEAAFVTKLDNAIGEARRVVDDGYPKHGPLRTLARRLVKDKTSFESLKAIEELLQGKISASALDRLKLIRVERNKFAHGEWSGNVLPFTVEEVRDLLKDLFEGTI